jgi:SAM-dependent methyltransferase
MRPAKPAGIYRSDLASIYDEGFRSFADGAAPGLLAILSRTGLKRGLIVDLGCGSGIWAAHLCHAGYRVLGVDVSPAMVDLARVRAPNAEFCAGSFRTFSIPRCSAITALSDVLCYQFDPDNVHQPLIHVFRRAFAALEPGGLFVFDIAEVGLDRCSSPRFCEGEDWMCFIRYKYDEKQDQLLRHILTFRKHGKLYRRRVEKHCLQLYRPCDIATMLKEVGFRVETTRRFGDFELMPRRTGFIARKE